jgi:hypothetical protein
VETRRANHRRVFIWSAGWWRNHQLSRLKSLTRNPAAARRWTALPRGRRLRLPWRMASGSRQPPKGARLMSAREREPGALPSPICPCLTERSGRDLWFLGTRKHQTFKIQHPTSNRSPVDCLAGCSNGLIALASPANRLFKGLPGGKSRFQPVPAKTLHSEGS